MKASEMRNLMVELLTGAAGGDRDRWTECVGSVVWRPMGLAIISNWTVDPKGTAEEIEVIRQAEELVREQYRFIVGD
jgi:hypothetical protein